MNIIEVESEQIMTASDMTFGPDGRPDRKPDWEDEPWERGGGRWRH